MFGFQNGDVLKQDPIVDPRDLEGFVPGPFETEESSCISQLKNLLFISINC